MHMIREHDERLTGNALLRAGERPDFHLVIYE
jgi:hypothetical protein